MTAAPSGTRILGTTLPHAPDVLTPEAVDFVARLQREFGEVRRARLGERAARREELASSPTGAALDFPASTAAIRAAEWSVAACPADLLDRRVEITGPWTAR